VAFESPHRLARSLSDMRREWGDRRIAVCRELTKAFEEVFRGRISEALERFTEPRGEFTLVVEGAAGPAAPSPDAARAELLRRKEAGEPAKVAVPEVVKLYGLPRRDVYRMWLDAGPERGQ
jgi:16S rRNA (cytidine1402-2'-O)-methyltransferase